MKELKNEKCHQRSKTPKPHQNLSKMKDFNKELK